MCILSKISKLRDEDNELIFNINLIILDGIYYIKLFNIQSGREIKSNGYDSLSDDIFKSLAKEYLKCCSSSMSLEERNSLILLLKLLKEVL
jgi:hypothetical protein